MEDPEATSQGNNLSLALRALDDGQIEQAIQLLQFAITVNPGNAEAHYHLGRAHLQRDRLPAAEAALRQAVQLAPRHAPAWSALGKTLFRQGNPRDARQALETALKLEPGNQDAAETLNLLPRPEDLILLHTRFDGTAIEASPAGIPSPIRRALMLSGLFVLLLGMVFLTRAFLQVRLLSELPTTPPAPVEERRGEPAAPPPEAPAAVPEEANAHRAPAEDDPEPIAPEALLRRVYEAQQQFRAAEGRYAMLVELEAAGALDPGSAAGEPLARFGNAVLSEMPPTATEFRVTASLPDGTVLAVGQGGPITP